MQTRGLKTMKAPLLALAATAALVLCAGQAANAAFSFNFDQTGTGTTGTVISGFNESAGNALAKGGDTAIAGGPGSTFQLYFQTTIGNLVGSPNGNPIGITGQLTAVGSITEVVTGVTLSPNGNSATFAVAPVQAANSGLSLYASPTATANPLAGTGFITGSPILTATPVVSTQGTLNSFQVAPGAPVAFDQSPSPAPVYAGITSVNGSGISTVDFKVLTTNPLYFPDGQPANFMLHLGSAGANVPFTAINPSTSFTANGVTVTPSIGTTNGLNGADFQFQTTGTITAVPEPSSLALMGLGLAGVFALARRKRAILVD